MRVAGERSVEVTVPKWNEIEQIRDNCFPNIAIKYIKCENSSSSSIEFYQLDEIRSGPKWKCPHQDGRSKEAIQSMKSFTPQKISMSVMSKPDEENLKLQQSVDKYVKRQRRYLIKHNVDICIKYGLCEYVYKKPLMMRLQRSILSTAFLISSSVKCVYIIVV